MTMELLKRIIEENNIPTDVHFMSDSGWECDPTEMNGVYYNIQSNTIVFTQGLGSDREYEQSDEWEILYYPELIKIQELEIYPASSWMSHGLNEEFKRALKEAGDFEQYYGIKETEDKYDEIDLQRTLFYSIKRNGMFIGYIGFHGEDTALEPEIYIFKQYRNKGYGTRVLKRFVNMAFTDGLMRVSRDKAEKETVFPEKLVSTVRVENEFSKKMMLACDFCESKKAAAEFILFLDDEGSGDGFTEVNEFEITKEEYVKRGAKHYRQSTHGKGPFFLVVTADEWCHDADEWLGIYTSRKEAREAYDRAVVWWEEENKTSRYNTPQKVTLFEFIIEDDRFREVSREELED